MMSSFNIFDLFKGGPLVCNGKLYGDVSSGYGCGLKDFPGIYGRISEVRQWIRDICGV
jgi:trypsin